MLKTNDKDEIKKKNTLKKKEKKER